MEKIIIQYFKTPLGDLVIGDFKSKLCLADWRYRKMRGAIDHRIQKQLNAAYSEGTSDLIESTKSQLNEYFSGNRKTFEIGLLLVGTAFQKRVWQELMKIPYGETETYMGLSKKLGNEKAIRAVANANGANAISMIIPCHRIIGSNQSLVGYAGGLAGKKKLLQLEGAITSSQLELF